MKYIRKTGCPHAYAQWCIQSAGTNKDNWSEVPSSQKRLLLMALGAEQGGLCAYTMRRIDDGSAHVEHIKPQSRCRAERSGSDLDYGNLVACFPRDGMRKHYRYGAQAKGDWWPNDPQEFVSPLQPACEKRFRFHLDGTVAASGGHRGACITIEILVLNHGTLVDDRKRVIEEFIYGPGGDDPLSPAKAAKLKSSVCVRTGGLYQEFCIAIVHALEEHLSRLTRSARRRRFARKRE
jgi:uncharacterized protein (TIGR02646 family)